MRAPVACRHRCGGAERGERGAATSSVVVLAALLTLVTSAALLAAGVLVAHRRAGTAADLGALAGAVAAQHGQDPCDAARRLVTRHDDAVVRRCAVAGDRVRLTVEVGLGVIAGRPLSVAARAHAGPR